MSFTLILDRQNVSLSKRGTNTCNHVNWHNSLEIYQNLYFSESNSTNKRLYTQLEESRGIEIEDRNVSVNVDQMELLYPLYTGNCSFHKYNSIFL